MAVTTYLISFIRPSNSLQHIPVDVENPKYLGFEAHRHLAQNLPLISITIVI